MSIIKNSNQKTGFTLIEVIVYIALASLIIAGVLVSAYPLLTGAEYTSRQVVIKNETVFILRKIAWALGQAVTDIAVSPAGDILTLETESGNLVIGQDGGMLTVNGLPLNSSRVPVTDFLVDYTVKSGPVPSFLEVSFLANNQPIGPILYNIY